MPEAGATLENHVLPETKLVVQHICSIAGGNKSIKMTKTVQKFLHSCIL